MPGNSKQSSKPSPETSLASGVGLGYVLGPQAAELLPNNPLFKGGNQPFDEAGSLPGSILTPFSTLQERAGESFFGGLSGDNPNPIFSQALNTAQGGAQNVNLPGISVGGGGFGGGGGGFDIPEFDRIVSQDASDQALDTLLNPTSVFDTLSGGPIVDSIETLARERSAAVTEKALGPGGTLETAMSIATSNLNARGLLSHSTVLRARTEAAGDVVRDLQIFETTQSLDSLKYLGDLAMQDILNGSNSAAIVLQQSLVEQGQNKALAASLAETAAANMRHAAELQLRAGIANQNNTTSLMMNNADNAVSILGLGQSDFQSTKADVAGVDRLPFDLLGQAQGIPGISSGSSKSL